MMPKPGNGRADTGAGVVDAPVGEALAHESAVNHVTGAAIYIDDIPEPPGLLHVATGQSPLAHGRLKSMNLSPVGAAEGVVDVITFSDIPGDPDISPVFTGDLLLADKELIHVGQPVFAVAATSLLSAKKACQLVEFDIESLDPVLTPQEALDREDFVLPTRTFEVGDADAAIDQADHLVEAAQIVRGQEHFYLEGQVSLAMPTEDGGIYVMSSSQHPSEIQRQVASVLGLSIHKVQAEVRRMGGGFGGKESQAAAVACMASLFAMRTGRPVKYRMPRQDDMVQTGKRHEFWNRYRAGFTDDGVITGVQMALAGLCGCTADLSEGIVDRAMFHADNAYHYPSARITGYRCKTNTVSNTAFRGFGGPQGMIAAESLMDDIARKLGKDPLDVRLANLYAPGRDVTPYGQKIEEHLLRDMMQSLAKDAGYRERRSAVTEFNRQSEVIRKGLALTPAKFGISFTAMHLNQAGALLHIYADGSIHLNHGGTEMGQGLYTKIAQIVATTLGVSYERIMVSSARTDKVPNTSATAASAGTDLNGMAARNAALKIRNRLLAFVANERGLAAGDVDIHGDKVLIKGKPLPFDEVIRAAYMNRVPLSATGFYKTPKIHFDKEAGKVLMDQNAMLALQDTAEGGINDSEYLIKQWHGVGRLGYAITPRFAGSSSSEQLSGAATSQISRCLGAIEGLAMATLGNAEALHLDGQIGNLQPGKEADFVLLDPNSSSLLARRIDRTGNIEDELFVYFTLGDERTVAATYVAGELFREQRLQE